MSRDNDTWVADLGRDGPARDTALAELRDALWRNLRKSLAHLPRADDAFLEDTVQDALLRVLDRLGQFAGRSRFVTWATAIAIRVAMTELRRRRWRDVSLDAAAAEPPAPAAEAPGPDERAALVDKLYELIRTRLTDRQRAALLAELKGMPQDEIARQLGSNHNALYKLTHDARRKLKQSLEEAGYTAETIRSAFTD